MRLSRMYLSPIQTDMKGSASSHTQKQITPARKKVIALYCLKTRMVFVRLFSEIRFPTPAQLPEKSAPIRLVSLVMIIA